MKNFKSLLILSIFSSTLFLNSCGDDSLSALELDIIGEWVVDDYILTGNNIAEDGTMQDMHMIFDSNFDVEVSWFEGGDFLVVDGTWSAFEDDSRLRLNLDNRIFYFCDDDDIEFNIFFFAGDMELDTECNGNDWMEIQLERL